MKKLMTSLALLSALGVGIAMPAHAQVYGGEGEYLSEYETGLWESDNFANDNYGVYDQDFGWQTAEEGWNTWYGDTENAWNTYDDIGDEGWFDV